MDPLDSAIKLATEKSTNAISDKVIRLSRLIISLNKILTSFQDGAVRAGAPQMVHFQVIEDIFFRDPQLFDDSLMDKFFIIKNELDSGITNLPLSGNENKIVFGEILAGVIKKRNKLRNAARLTNAIIWILLTVVFLWLGIVGAAIAQSKWNELFCGSSTLRNQTTQVTVQRLNDSTKHVGDIRSYDTTKLTK